MAKDQHSDAAAAAGGAGVIDKHEAIKEKLERLFDDRLTKPAEDFEVPEINAPVPIGSTHQASKGPNTGAFFKIKERVQKVGGWQKIQHTALGSEYISGLFFKRFLYDRAPNIALVKREYEVSLRSKFLDNFQMLSRLDSEKWSMVRGLEKVIAATIFLHDVDAHMNNVGVIEKDEIEVEKGVKKEVKKLYAAKIDHGRALGSLKANGGVWKALNSMYDTGYSKFVLNIKEFQDAFNEMAKISDEEIEQLVGKSVQELSRLGLLSAKPPATPKELPATPKEVIAKVIANTILELKQIILNNRSEVQYFLNSLGVSQSPDSPSLALQVSELIGDEKWSNGLWIHADIDYHDIDMTSKRRALETLHSKLEQKVWPDYLKPSVKFIEAKRLVEGELDQEIVKNPMNVAEAEAASARIKSQEWSREVIYSLHDKNYDEALKLLTDFGPKILPGELELDIKILGDEHGIINFAVSCGLSHKNKDHLPIFEALFRTGVSTEKAERYIKESPELTRIAIRNDKDNTPLASALKLTSGQAAIKIINELLNEGADPNERNKDGSLPIHIAATNIVVGNHGTDALKLLLKDRRTDVNAPDKYGYTILHTLMRFQKSYLCAELLNEEKYNPNIADNKGETILHIAVKNKDEAMINTIIKNERFHNFSAPNNEGKTALALAKEKGMDSIALLLENKEAEAVAIAEAADKAGLKPSAPPIPAEVLAAAAATVSPQAAKAIVPQKHVEMGESAAAGADHKPPSPGSSKRVQPGYNR